MGEVRTTTSAPSSTCKWQCSGGTAATAKGHYSARACKCPLRVHTGQRHLSASGGRLCRTLFERQRRSAQRACARASPAATGGALHATRAGRASQARRDGGATERSGTHEGMRGRGGSASLRCRLLRSAARGAPHLMLALRAPTTMFSMSLLRRVRNGSAAAWCWRARSAARVSSWCSKNRARGGSGRQHALATHGPCAERALRPSACWRGASQLLGVGRSAPQFKALRP